LILLSWVDRQQICGEHDRGLELATRQIHAVGKESLLALLLIDERHWNMNDVSMTQGI